MCVCVCVCVSFMQKKEKEGREEVAGSKVTMNDGDDGDPSSEPWMGTRRGISPLHGRRLLICGQMASEINC